MDGHVCVVCPLRTDLVIDLSLSEDGDDAGREIGMVDDRRGVVSPLWGWRPLRLDSLLSVDLVREVSWLSSRSI